MGILKSAVLVIGLCLAALSIFQLERARQGVEMRGFSAGTTPVTLYQVNATGPLIVIAHGFAGSRQFMESFSLTLARAGFRVAAFDFEGHGRNPVPMSGDVTAIDGTTARLVAETARVIAAARAETEWAGAVGLLGHSMASDVIIRTALADQGVGPLVAVSMYSEAVTATAPDQLLMLTGQWEPHLRAAALEALRLADPGAGEGDTAAGPVLRRAEVAPFVEHVGVLYSPTSLREARAWFAAANGFVPNGPLAVTGPWIGALMAAVVLLAWPLAALGGPRRPAPAALPRGQFLAVIGVPALVAPVIAATIETRLLPVMVAETLAVMLLFYGALQLAALWALGHRPGRLAPLPLALLLFWGVAVFGLLLDRYAASFMPTPARLPIIAALAVGTVPFMLADAMLTQAGQARLWRRITARLALFGALMIAVALDPERLFFLIIIFPILILFFCVHGLMGRWVGQHGGAMAAGLGLGVVLAWALGVSFPLFDARG